MNFQEMIVGQNAIIAELRGHVGRIAAERDWALARAEKAEKVIALAAQWRRADDTVDPVGSVLQGLEAAEKRVEQAEAEKEAMRGAMCSAMDERNAARAEAEGFRKQAEAGSGCSRKVVGPGPLPDLMVPLREFVFNLPPGSSVTFKRGD